MSINSLRRFYDSLCKVANVFGCNPIDVSRPIYLRVCRENGISGWSKEEIINYPNGWAGLKKEAIRLQRAEEVTIEEALAVLEPPIYTKTVVEEDNDDDEYTFDDVMQQYVSFVKKFKYVPKLSTFKKWCPFVIKRSVCSSIDELDDCLRNYNDNTSKYLCDSRNWNEDYVEETRKEIKKYKRFLITSVGSFCDIDFDFLKSMKCYAEKNDALVIGLPLFKRYDKALLDFSVDPEVQEYLRIIPQDIEFNKNLMVQAIRNNCTTKSTVAGLNHLVARHDSSIIVAGANQQLKYIPVLKDKTPYLIASTGCCTEYQPVRKDDFRLPTKAEKLAHDRFAIKGALVVELGENDTFTVRNIEADEDGSFIDLGICYNPDGTTYTVEDSTFIIGDLHAPQHNEELVRANLKAVEMFNCNKVVVHDSVNMGYVSHHNANQFITKAQMVEEGRAHVLEEINVFADILQQISEIPCVDSVIIPYSNHPAHLEKFIQDMPRMINDPINLRISLHSAIAMLDRKNVLQYLVEEMAGVICDNIDWVAQDEGRCVYGVQVGLHGSESVNGGRMTSTSTNNAFNKTVLAHKHTAGIDGDTITVGIACDKEQGYNHGLSSWTESSAIIYPNGKAQLLTFVNMKGGYKLWL